MDHRLKMREQNADTIKLFIILLTLYTQQTNKKNKNSITFFQTFYHSQTFQPTLSLILFSLFFLILGKSTNSTSTSTLFSSDNKNGNGKKKTMDTFFPPSIPLKSQIERDKRLFYSMCGLYINR